MELSGSVANKLSAFVMRVGRPLRSYALRCLPTHATVAKRIYAAALLSDLNTRPPPLCQND